MWMPLHAIQKITKSMTISLVQYMVTCLNMLQSKNGIFSDLSPEEIILGYPNPDYNNLRVTFGLYVQVFIGTTNITKHIPVGAIAMRP